MVECTLSITHCLRLNLQLHTISLVMTCRISSFCTVAWQLARLLLTRRIAQSLGDSWASCHVSHSFSIPATWCCIFMSRNFHPCKLVPQIHVSHFPPLQHGAAFSCPASSCLAFSASPLPVCVGVAVINYLLKTSTSCMFTPDDHLAKYEEPFDVCLASGKIMLSY